MTSRVAKAWMSGTAQADVGAWRCALAVLVMLGAIACVRVLDPGVPDGALPLSAPEEYTLWWSLTQRCSARQGSFADVRWFVVPHANSFAVDGKQVDGHWSPAQNAITIAEGSVVDGGLVRHEMLHALLGPGGEAHPREYFVTRCGGIVACDTDCLRDAGSPLLPSAGAPTVKAESLPLGLEIVPNPVSVQGEGSWFVIIDSVRNPYSYPIWVKAPPFRNLANSSTAFGYTVRGPGLSMDYQGMVRDSLLSFTPGEVKRMAYDVGPAYGLTIGPGSYAVRGIFSRDTTPPQTVVIHP